MTIQELIRWYELREGEKVCNQIGLQAPKDEHEELTRLNFLVMEEAHDIHNSNMLGETHA